MKAKSKKLARFTLPDSIKQVLEQSAEHAEASWQTIAAATEQCLDAQDALRLSGQPYATSKMVFAEVSKSALIGRSAAAQYHSIIYGARDGLGEALIQEYRQFGISHWRLFRPEAKRRIGPKAKGDSAEDYRQRLETECESIAEHWAEVAAKRGAVSVPVDEVKQEYKHARQPDTRPLWLRDLDIAALCLSTVYQNMPTDICDEDRAEALDLAQMASKLAEKHEATK